MGIPNRTLDRLESRDKVKIGEKRTSKAGKEYPAATDYFLSCDPDFARLYGNKARALTVTFPFATADANFSTGLERWLTKKDKTGQTLTCYTKDDGENPVALRFTDFVKDWDEVRGPEKGARTPVTCKADECPFFKDASCKPMGRLQFYLDGDNHAQPLEFATKSWNSIERIAGALKSFERLGPLNKPDRRFKLSVSFFQKGTSRFPVVVCEEIAVVITPDNIDIAAALFAANVERETDAEDRVVLAHLLDVIRPGWNDDPKYIERIKEVGATAALDGIFQRYEA